VIAAEVSQARRYARLGRAGLVALAAAALLLAAPALLAPWPELTLPGAAAYPAAERWQAAQWGALLGVMAGSVAALAWQPRRADAPRIFLLLLGLGALLAVPFLPAAGLFLFGLIAACSGPGWHILRPAQPVRASRLLLLLGLCAATLALADARSTLLNLLAGTLTPGHAGAALLLDGGLILASLLAGCRRPGALWLAGMAAAALIYLGLAAAIVPGAAGGWGRGMSMLASANGWALVGAALYQWRQAYMANQTRLPRLSEK
jgi:hypothetical protein